MSRFSASNKSAARQLALAAARRRARRSDGQAARPTLLERGLKNFIVAPSSG